MSLFANKTMDKHCNFLLGSTMRNTKLQSEFTRHFHILLDPAYPPLTFRLWVGEVHRKCVFPQCCLDVDIGNKLFYFHDDLSD